MEEEIKKRFTAYRVSIGMLLSGEPSFDGERFRGVLFNSKEIVRVNLIATVIDKFVSELKPYIAVTLDDNTGMIRVKAFADDLPLLEKIEIGDTVLVIGVLRYFGGELYILPEIVKIVDPKWLLARRLELIKEYGAVYEKTKKDEIIDQKSLRSKLLEIIESSEPEGIPIEKIILTLEEPPELINQEIQALLEEGTIFEPKPGVLRIL